MDNNLIQLGHGSGGSLMKDLIDKEFLSVYIDKKLYCGDDASVLSNIKLGANQQLCMSTDTFVVSPQFFPGGDIGKLCVCGTVNDVSTSGGVPTYLSVAFVIEQGFEIAKLKRICKSIAKTANEVGVSIVTGDTKVVESGKCDGIFINTTGIGIKDKKHNLSGNNIKDGDVVLVSGTIGDHGMAIMSVREGLSFSTSLKSDVCPLNSLIQDVLKVCPAVRCFRDPTRGGIASTLNEIANQSGVDITVNQVEVPIKKNVKSACDMLGLDPFMVANEGKMICVVPSKFADNVLSAMRGNKYGKEAAIIGFAEKCQSKKPKVYIQTQYKSKRILDMPIAEQLPRIC